MDIFYASWKYLVLSAPYLLAGLVFSGIIHEFLNTQSIRKSLEKNSLSNIVKAALIGIPLPLCSCSVIPTAVTLKKAGAGNASTSSFLVATPESGVDSMAMTWAVMDLPMTIFRPIAAFFSAIVAGIAQMFFNPDEKKIIDESSCPKCPSEAKTKDFASTLKRMMKYAFGDLVDDMASWLLLGIVMGGMIDLFFPAELFMSLGGWNSRLLVLMVGTPVYICASAATPIAASLVLKGMSPGAALVFLLVGPATNISNLLVLQKYIGKKGILLNVVSIVVTALLASFLVDFCYEFFGWPSSFKIASHTHEEHTPWWQTASAVFLGVLILKGAFFDLKDKLKKFS